MYDLKNEISRDIPDGYPEQYFVEGEPIMYCFECALIERKFSSGYVYLAQNLNTSNATLIKRRSKPMAPNKDIEMAYLISRSKVAGAGRYQIDRPLGEHISFEKAVEILLHIFHELLSKYGYTVRIEQIELARHI